MENKRYGECFSTEVACDMTPKAEELLTALKEQRNHNRMVYEEGYDAGLRLGLYTAKEELTK